MKSIRTAYNNASAVYAGFTGDHDSSAFRANGGDTQSRNLRKKLAQVSCITFSCKFMQVRLTTHQIKTGVLGRNK